jgi:pimeloyl-ACP methyl ester carboxylesterase
MAGGANASPASREPVLVLHGLWQVPLTMQPLRRRLAAAGFDAACFGYRSILASAVDAIPALQARLRALAEARGGPVHVVGHSLGGVLALAALGDDPALPVGRVVCLGSPLAGSAAARGLRARPLTRWMAGRSGVLLERGVGGFAGLRPTGVLAGDRALGIGTLLAGGAAGGFTGPNDGSVAVDETRPPGLADHRVLPLTHTGLMLAPSAAALAARFLRAGRFG